MRRRGELENGEVQILNQSNKIKLRGSASPREAKSGSSGKSLPPPSDSLDFRMADFGKFIKKYYFPRLTNVSQCAIIRESIKFHHLPFNLK
jgi:hypothetical protein